MGNISRKDFTVTIILAIVMIFTLVTIHCIAMENTYKVNSNTSIYRDKDVTINWNATEVEAMEAIAKWQQLKTGGVK